MTLQNLGKILDRYESQLGSSSVGLELLKGLPFYCQWPNSEEEREARPIRPINGTSIRDCCFNHGIGLPRKNNQLYPLFDYEQMLYQRLQQYKHLWIKKATGLGVTEFMLRYMAWLAFRDRTLEGKQMCIVTGPRIELAITLIDRMKRLFQSQAASSFTQNRASRSSTTSSNSITFDTKETVIELNGVHIEAYPSHYLDSMRGLKDVSFIYLDESDFFPPGQQQDALDVSERYIGKSNPWIDMVSTSNALEGLFERIEKEPESKCLYRRLFLDYTYGLDKIYTAEEIQAAKASPSFEREYNLKYLGLIGNVFHTKDIDAAMDKGKTFADRVNAYSQKSVGLDPGFGSSNFGVCITELVDGMVNVLHAEEYQRPDFNEMISLTTKLLDQYNIRFDNSCRIFVDAANPSFISTLKQAVNEDPEYVKQIAYYKKHYPSVYDLQFLQQNMFVIPVPFSKEHKNMLAHCKALLEYQTGYVTINPKHTKLITALRTAVENGEGYLDKEATSHDDCFDSFRLSLMFWH